MNQDGVYSLDAGQRQFHLPGELEGRGEVGLDIHGAMGDMVLPYLRLGGVWVAAHHVVDRLLGKVVGKAAALGGAEAGNLVEDTKDEVADVGLFQKGLVAWGVEYDAQGMERNGSGGSSG